MPLWHPQKNNLHRNETPVWTHIRHDQWASPTVLRAPPQDIHPELEFACVSRQRSCDTSFQRVCHTDRETKTSVCFQRRPAFFLLSLECPRTEWILPPATCPILPEHECTGQLLRNGLNNEKVPRNDQQRSTSSNNAATSAPATAAATSGNNAAADASTTAATTQNRERNSHNRKRRERRRDETTERRGRKGEREEVKLREEVREDK